MKKKKLVRLISSIVVMGTMIMMMTGCSNKTQDVNDSATEEVTDTAEEVADTVEEVTESEENDVAEEKIVIKYGTLASQIQPALATKLGYFEEEGIEVELVVFDAGPAEVEAFTSGDLDIIQVGDLPFLNGVNNGVDLQIIGFYQSSTKDGMLGVRDEANIQSFADLKGKTISVPFGSNVQPLLYEMLAAGGLTPDDVELVNLTAADGANALVSGDVDAALAWDPFLHNAVAQGGITVFADSSEFRPLVCPIATSTKYAADNHETIEKLLNALNKAATYAKENTEEAANLVADYFGADSSDSYVLSIENKDLDVRLTDEKINAIKKASEKCYEFGIIESEVDVDAHIAKEYVE